MTKLDRERLLFSELRVVLQACIDARLPVVVIGGLATGTYLRRYRRFTEDIDLVVPPAEVEQLLRLLQSHGFSVTGTQHWWKQYRDVKRALKTRLQQDGGIR